MKIDWKKFAGGVFIIFLFVIISIYAKPVEKKETRTDNNEGKVVANIFPRVNDQKINTPQSVEKEYSIENDPNVKIEYSTSTVNICKKKYVIQNKISLANVNIVQRLKEITDEGKDKGNLCENLKLNNVDTIQLSLYRRDYNNEIHYYILDSRYRIDLKSNKIYFNDVFSGELDYIADLNKKGAM